MQIPIPESWKRLWEEWDLRAFIILSLTLQTILILLAPLRKRTASVWLTAPLWAAYLLADWAANFAVGLISNSQSTDSSSSKAVSDSNNADLLAFWAPFLLVHLGGPDTITALALEDNELWGRHLIALIFQFLAAVYVFFQSLPENKLWIPTLLMLVAGTIKYAERTRSLYLASLNSFRDSMLKEPDPGPNYAKLMDEYRSKKEAMLPTRIKMIPEPDRRVKAMNKVKEGKLKDSEIKLHAYNFFKTFKGLIVDLIFSFRERNQSRDFFLKRTAEDAFKLVEVELNLMYAVLFTKFSVVYTGLGYFARFISFASVGGSLGLFYYESKAGFDSFDIAITYTLLWGAIALDIIAFLMLICSDWLFVHIKKLPEVLEVKNTQNDTGKKKPFPEKLQELAKKSWKSLKRFPHVLFPQLTRFFSRRWRQSISQFNLINYCLHPRLPVKEKFIGYLGLTNFLDLLKYVEHKPFHDDLRDHIFEELHAKSELADDLDTSKDISSARGDWILRVEGHIEFLPYTIEVDYDQSLLLWHIATELCYNEDRSKQESTPPPDSESQLSIGGFPAIPEWQGLDSHLDSYDEYRSVEKESVPPNMYRSDEQESAPPNKYREFSKLLSDYMIYLLMQQPTLMSAVTGIGQIRFRDTCAEAKRLFNKEARRHKKPNIGAVIFYFIWSVFRYLYYSFRAIVNFLIFIAAMRCFNRGKKADDDHNDPQREACKKIHDVNTDVDPVSVKGDRSKSVLFDACILAKELEKLGEKKWQVMSKVWVELLTYAAIHCRADSHAQQLSKGGELITLVWLLAAHFGLGDQFQISEGHARAKLIVEK